MIFTEQEPTMILHTLWGARHDESTPELMVAWDEYSVDTNYEGFREDCERAIASWGADLSEKRALDININEDLLMEAFAETHIDGTISSPAVVETP